MNVDFSCTVPDMKFGDFRNGRTTGLGQYLPSTNSRLLEV